MLDSVYGKPSGCKIPLGWEAFYFGHRVASVVVHVAVRLNKNTAFSGIVWSSTNIIADEVGTPFVN